MFAMRHHDMLHQLKRVDAVLAFYLANAVLLNICTSLFCSRNQNSKQHQQLLPKYHCYDR